MSETEPQSRQGTVDEFIVRIEGRAVSTDELLRGVVKQLADLHDDVDRYGPALCGIDVRVERRSNRAAA